MKRDYLILGIYVDRLVAGKKESLQIAQWTYKEWVGCYTSILYKPQY